VVAETVNSLPEIGSWIYYARTMELVGASGVARYLDDDYKHDEWLRGPVTGHDTTWFVVRMQNFRERSFSLTTENYCWRRPSLLDLLADV